MKLQKSNFSKFMLLWGGELISAIGGGLTSFGLGVYVFGQTGSAADMALVMLAAFLPTLLLSVPAGVLADRYDRRLLMMIGDGCSALGILYILVCMLRGAASLHQICIGVFISSTFSALLEPSYRATITDLLTKEEYSKASGMVSIAGSARYLISPVLAGALLAVGDIKWLLIIDICTFFPTVIGAAVVKKEIAVKTRDRRESLVESLKEGWKAVTGRRGIWILILVSALITCFMGKVIVRSLSSTANELNAPKRGCFSLSSSLVITAPLFCSAPVPDAVTIAPIGMQSVAMRRSFPYCILQISSSVFA